MGFLADRLTSAWTTHRQPALFDANACCHAQWLADGTGSLPVSCSGETFPEFESHTQYNIPLLRFANQSCLCFNLKILPLSAPIGRLDTRFCHKFLESTSCLPHPIPPSVALLVARRTNDRKVAGSRPTKVVCITVLTGNRMGVNCPLWPAATPSFEL